jgi:hypothetical protein
MPDLDGTWHGEFISRTGTSAWTMPFNGCDHESLPLSMSMDAGVASYLPNSRKFNPHMRAQG